MSKASDDKDDNVDSRQSLIQDEGTTYYKKKAAVNSKPFVTNHEVKIDSLVGHRQPKAWTGQVMESPNMAVKMQKSIENGAISLTTEKTIASGGRRQVSCASYDEHRKQNLQKLTASFSKVELKKTG